MHRLHVKVLENTGMNQIDLSEEAKNLEALNTWVIEEARTKDLIHCNTFIFDKSFPFSTF